MTQLPVFNVKAYLAKRRLHRKKAYLFGVLGAIVLFNSGSPLPIPLIGVPSVIVGGALLLYASSQWNLSNALPIREAVELTRLQGGEVARSDLFVTLELTQEQTDALLTELVQKGFLESVNDDLMPANEPRYRLIS